MQKSNSKIHIKAENYIKILWIGLENWIVNQIQSEWPNTWGLIKQITERGLPLYPGNQQQ